MLLSGPMPNSIARENQGESAARSMALLNALKSVCAKEFYVNAGEVDQMIWLLKNAFPENPKAFQAALASEEAKVRAQTDQMGAAAWCADQKEKLTRANDGRTPKMFR
jgi:hypothetical protein